MWHMKDEKIKIKIKIYSILYNKEEKASCFEVTFSFIIIFILSIFPKYL